MGKNHCINGVNWSSLRKFAEYTFDGGVKMHKIVDDKYYLIFIDKKAYNENPVEVDKFENFFMVNLKPLEY